MEKSKEELVDLIIKAMKGEDILSLIQHSEKEIKIASILRTFERGNVDETTVQNIAEVIRNFKHKISKEDLLILLEKVTLECEDFGCFYDDYRDDYYNEPLFETIGEALVEKDLTQEDIERLGKIIDQDEYELTTPLLDVFVSKAERDPKFFALVKKILQLGYRVNIVVENKMYDEAKNMLEDKDLDLSEKMELLKLIDPEKMLQLAEEYKMYDIIVEYFIETNDYEKAKMYIKRIINEDKREEVFHIISNYLSFILQDRELSNIVAKYLLDVGNIFSVSKLYNNIDDKLKDLYAEKILELEDFFSPEFLDVICERKPEKLKDYLLKFVESEVGRGSKVYDYIASVLKSAKKCMGKEEFNMLLDEIKSRYYTKYKLMEKIDELRYNE